MNIPSKSKNDMAQKTGSGAGRPVAWMEVVRKDGERLNSFFSDLSGWETTEVAPSSHYGVMDASPHGIGGGSGSSQQGPGHVTFFIEVENLEGTLRDVERLGRKRIAGPINIPDKRPSAGGRGSVNFAYFADPEGHVIGLCKGIIRE
jgi:predicted enzyme related to lactoylglutathione lyase